MLGHADPFYVIFLKFRYRESFLSFLGLFILLVVVAMSTYCGLLLTQAWVKVKEKRGDTAPLRDPYPYIGEVAVGVRMRHAVTFCVNLQLVLTCVIYLILASGIMSSFVSFHIGDIHTEKLANIRYSYSILTAHILDFKP